MKKFVILISGDEEAWESISPAEMQAGLAKYMAFSERLRHEGRLVDAEGLSPTGKRIKRHGAEIMVTDGPFAESREIVGGYFVFTAQDLEEATAIAKDCPAVEFGSTVDVRPVMDY